MADRRHSYEHVLSYVLTHPWAITREMLSTIALVLGREVAGLHASDDELAAALVNRKNLPQPTEGGAVAIIPIHGVLAPRAGLMSDVSGMTSYDKIGAQLREAMANKAVRSVVFDVDSPGGSVAGATELTREILKARTKKPIIAVAQYTMGSAAYWLSAAATEIVASPSAMVGSVGVYSIHDDLSAALAEHGIKRTFISAGKFKTDGNEAEPLSATAKAAMEERVESAYAQFIGDISKGRGVPIEDVKSGFGEGRTVGANEAKKLNMIDRIATLDDTIARVMAGHDQLQARAADLDMELALFEMNLSLS